MGEGLESRVRRLERWNAALVLVILLGGAALGWRGASDGVVRADRVEVVDAQGRARIVMEAAADGPTLQLLDAAGVARATLGDDAEGTALYLRDGDGTTRVGVAQFAHGGGGFALHGPDAKGAAVLYLKGDGSLTFFDAAGDVQARYPGG